MTVNRDYAAGNRQAGSLADGIEILDADQARCSIAAFASQAQASCKQIHGHAAGNNLHIIGCTEDETTEGGGLLVLHAGAGREGWTARRLSYPDGGRVSTIKSRPDSPMMIANYGKQQRYDALLRIDPNASALSRDDDVFAMPGGQAVSHVWTTPFCARGNRDAARSGAVMCPAC